jgi:hypothetical protein
MRGTALPRSKGLRRQLALMHELQQLSAELDVLGNHSKATEFESLPIAERARLAARLTKLRDAEDPKFQIGALVLSVDGPRDTRSQPEQ